MSINPQSPYGVLRDQGDDCPPQYYRPKNQFMTTPDPINVNHIRSTIGFKYYQQPTQSNPAIVSAVSSTVNFQVCNQTSGDNCGEIGWFDTIGNYHLKEQVLIDSLNHSEEKELYFTELLHHYLGNDSIDAACRMLDSVLDTISEYILYSTDLFRKEIDTNRTALDMLPDVDSNTMVFKEFFNVYLDLVAGIKRIDSLPASDSMQIALGAAKSTSNSINNRGWLSYYFDNDFDEEAEEWPLLGKKGNESTEPEATTTNTINVFPNPNNGLIQITGLEYKNTYTIQIFTINGQKLRDVEVTGEETFQISIKHLSTGIYHIQIKSKSGNILLKKKLIKSA